MTIEQFRYSNEKVQALAINQGSCVGGRDQGEHKVLLFQVKDFYVEVFYHPRRKVITQYKALEEEDLDAYLAQVQIPLELFIEQ